MKPLANVAILTSIILFLYALHTNRQPTHIFPSTKPPKSLSEIPQTGVSHNREIKKQVLASYMELPHITQIARSVLKKGQTASENWHRDMSEMFVFLQGQGVLQLDSHNFSITVGSFVKVHPPTRHTIYNTAEEDLVLFSVASVP